MTLMYTTKTTTATDRDLVRFDALDTTGLTLTDIAELLRDHGASHLSLIERIELAERLTRRRFIIGAGGLIGAAALGACGAEEQAAAPTATNAPMTRRVETEKGPVDVPVNPQRVLAPYATDADVAMVLGLPLVGAGTARGFPGQPFPDYQPADALTGVTPVSIFPGANYEQLAALNPDLIICQFMAEENGYALLSQIAPTIWYEKANRADWRKGLEEVATAVDRNDVFQTFMRTFDERVAQLKPLVAQRWAGKKLMLISTYENLLWISPREQENMSIFYEALGFVAAAGVPATLEDVQAQGYDKLSLEQLILLKDIDILLIWRSPAEQGEGRLAGEWDSVLDSPLYQQIPAVRTGTVFDFNAELFYGSPLTATALLDFVEQTLLA